MCVESRGELTSLLIRSAIASPQIEERFSTTVFPQLFEEMLFRNSKSTHLQYSNKIFLIANSKLQVFNFFKKKNIASQLHIRTSAIDYYICNITVLDLVSQIRDVVLVRCIFNSRNPKGSGFWNGEGMGRGWKWGDQFTSNLGPRWTGSYHSKEGSK